MFIPGNILFKTVLLVYKSNMNNTFARNFYLQMQRHVFERQSQLRPEKKQDNEEIQRKVCSGIKSGFLFIF